MNRQQAEHLLDAYVDLENGGGDNKARQSLREVILDAMTQYRSTIVSTYPSVTCPSTRDTNPYKPIVTCGVVE